MRQVLYSSHQCFVLALSFVVVVVVAIVVYYAMLFLLPLMSCSCFEGIRSRESCDCKTLLSVGVIVVVVVVGCFHFSVKLKIHRLKYNTIL